MVSVCTAYLDHLSEWSLSNHFSDLVSVHYVIVKHLDVAPILIIKAYGTTDNIYLNSSLRVRA